MTRHIADRFRARSDVRLQVFLRQEKATLPNAKTLALQARPKDRAAASRRLVEYLRIERGRSV